MSLHETLESELRAAMKQRDRDRTSALRMVIAALNNRAIADGTGQQGRLDDDVVIQVLSTEVKRRREAAKAFEDAGRSDQAAKEAEEARVYESFLPAQLDDDEILAVVDRVIGEAGAQGPADIGKVMKPVMAEISGRADGSRVSALVRERLSG